MLKYVAPVSKPVATGVFVVAAPRAGDTIGSALRSAYDPPGAITDELTALIRQLDDNPGRA